jgi:pimeloyl-ACP methyl ester carboxylesterase
MQIVVNNLLINYEQQGEGKVLLLLHGWGDASSSWKVLAAKLAAQYRVVVIDLPGFGGSEAPKEVWGLEAYARLVAGALTKLNLRPYAVVGHSNGGAIAIKAISNGFMVPERLVLIGSAGIRDRDRTRKRLLRYLAKTAKVLTRPLPQDVRTTIRRRAYGAIGSDMFVAEHLQESFRKVVGEDVQAEAAKLSVPTLLMYGENDTATPPAYGELLHQAIDGSMFEIIGGAGHFVHHDRPEVVEKLITEFLQ